ALDLDGVDREPAIVADEEARHLEPVMCRRRGPPLLEGLDRRRDERHTLEIQRFHGVAGDQQVTDVRRVETPPKEPDPHSVSAGQPRAMESCRAGPPAWSAPPPEAR